MKGVKNMNVMRNDKVVLTKAFDNLKKVGSAFEVANVTDTKVVLREVTSKVAVGAIDIEDFEEYFTKPEEFKGWTEWVSLMDGAGNVIAHYRVNGKKKVQVRTPDGYRAEANCCEADEFNVFFGIRLAYERCMVKSLDDAGNALVMEISNLEEKLKNVRAMMSETRHVIKMMINSLEVPKEH